MVVLGNLLSHAVVFKLEVSSITESLTLFLGDSVIVKKTPKMCPQEDAR